MSYVLPASINLIEYSGRPWSDVKFIEKDGGAPSGKKSSSPKEYKSTRLLPRTDHALFGKFPKLDTRVLLECEKCGKVLVPSVYNAHCAQPEHRNMQPIVPPPAVAPTKASMRARKAATKPAAALSHAAAVSSAGVGTGVGIVLTPTPPGVPVAALAAAASAASASNGRAGKHRKNSKSNKRSRKEEKSEPQAGAAAARSPEAHPAKVGKQDVDHLVAVAISASAASPSADASASVPPSPLQTYVTALAGISDDLSFAEMSDKEEVEEEEHIATSTVPTLSTMSLEPDSVTPNHAISINTPAPTHQHPPLEAKEEPSAVSSEHSHDEEQADNSPLDHMPMSPVAVVNIVPVQNFQYLQQYLQLPTQPIVVTIPCTSPNTHMYSYPKPLTVTTRALRRLGNTYLLQNQRMEHQRAEIQAITRSRCEYSNASTLNHLPT